MKKLLIASLVAASLCGCTTRVGEKVGIVVKVAQEGLICKTYEAELVRGGLQAGTGVNGRSFDFTIRDEATANKLQEAMDQGKEVLVKYHKENFVFCSSETGYFLDSFQTK